MKIIHTTPAKTKITPRKFIRYMMANSYSLIIMMTPLLLHFLLQLLLGFLQQSTEKPHVDTPAAATAVAVSFFTALMQGQYKDATALTTADAHESLQEFSLAVAEGQAEQLPPVVVKHFVTAHKAYVTIEHNPPLTLHLVKEQGVWKVDLLSTASEEEKISLQYIYKRLSIPEKQH